MKPRRPRKPRDKKLGHDRPDHPRYSLTVTYRIFKAYEVTKDIEAAKKVMRECGVFEPLSNGRDYRG